MISVDEIIKNIKSNKQNHFSNLRTDINFCILRQDLVSTELDNYEIQKAYEIKCKKLKDTVRLAVNISIESGKIFQYPIVFYSAEGFALDENSKVIVEVLLEYKDKISDILNRVIFLMGSYNHSRDTYLVNGLIRLHDISLFYQIRNRIPSNILDNNSKNVVPNEKILKKTFGCFLFRPAYDRIKIAEHLIINHHDKTTLMCSQNQFLDVLNRKIDNFDRTKYINTSMKSVNDKHYHTYILKDLMLKTKNVFVDIISETLFYEDDNVWFTEKTIYPILIGLPFITSSTSGFYKLLHYFGFKTFSNFWDESFDDIIDHEERNKKFMDILDYIAITYNTEQKRQETYKKMLPILQHNRQHMIFLLNNPEEMLSYIKHSNRAIEKLKYILKSAYPNN